MKLKKVESKVGFEYVEKFQVPLCNKVRFISTNTAGTKLLVVTSCIQIYDVDGVPSLVNSMEIPTKGIKGVNFCCDDDYVFGWTRKRVFVEHTTAPTIASRSFADLSNDIIEFVQLQDAFLTCIGSSFTLNEIQEETRQIKELASGDIGLSVILAKSSPDGEYVGLASEQSIEIYKVEGLEHIVQYKTLERTTRLSFSSFSNFVCVFSSRCDFVRVYAVFSDYSWKRKIRSVTDAVMAGEDDVFVTSRRNLSVYSLADGFKQSKNLPARCNGASVYYAGSRVFLYVQTCGIIILDNDVDKQSVLRLEAVTVNPQMVDDDDIVDQDEEVSPHDYHSEIIISDGDENNNVAEHDVQTEYEIGKILARRILDVDGEPDYYLTWKGFAKRFASWEPLSHFAKGIDAVIEFEEECKSEGRSTQLVTNRKRKRSGYINLSQKIWSKIHDMRKELHPEETTSVRPRASSTQLARSTSLVFPSGSKKKTASYLPAPKLPSQPLHILSLSSDPVPLPPPHRTPPPRTPPPQTPPPQTPALQTPTPRTPTPRTPSPPLSSVQPAPLSPPNFSPPPSPTLSFSSSRPTTPVLQRSIQRNVSSSMKLLSSSTYPPSQSSEPTTALPILTDELLREAVDWVASLDADAIAQLKNAAITTNEFTTPTTMVEKDASTNSIENLSMAELSSSISSSLSPQTAQPDPTQDPPHPTSESSPPTPALPIVCDDLLRDALDWVASLDTDALSQLQTVAITEKELSATTTITDTDVDTSSIGNVNTVCPVTTEIPISMQSSSTFGNDITNVISASALPNKIFDACATSRVGCAPLVHASASASPASAFAPHLPNAFENSILQDWVINPHHDQHRSNFLHSTMVGRVGELPSFISTNGSLLPSRQSGGMLDNASLLTTPMTICTPLPGVVATTNNNNMHNVSNNYSSGSAWFEGPQVPHFMPTTPHYYLPLTPIQATGIGVFHYGLGCSQWSAKPRKKRRNRR